MIVPRALKNKATEACAKMPVLTITGPRQSGKTTFIRKNFPDYEYVNLEDLEVRDYAQRDPKGFLEKYNKKVVFDEIQHVAGLLSYIQVISDAENVRGRFILSGSNNMLLNEKIAQSLAGRSRILQLLPFSMSELAGTKWQQTSYEECIFKGFYPRIYSEDLNPTEWLQDYIQTYVEKDVRQLVNIGDLSRFQQFLKLCAGNIGQLINYSKFGNELGISYHTAQSWLSLLEAAYIIFRLPPYYRNFNKRIIKSHKLYFFDTGIASYLLGLRKKGGLSSHFARGALFENLIISEIYKNKASQGLRPELYYWRDSAGQEIDCLFEDDGNISAIEIKAGKTIHEDFFNGLQYFMSLGLTTGIHPLLIYGGKDLQERKEITVAGWNRLGEVT